MAGRLPMYKRLPLPPVDASLLVVTVVWNGAPFSLRLL